MGRKIRILKSKINNSAEETFETPSVNTDEKGEDKSKNPVEWWAEDANDAQQRSPEKHDDTQKISQEHHGEVQKKPQEHHDDLQKKPQEHHDDLQKKPQEHHSDLQHSHIPSDSQKTARVVLVACALVFTLLLAVGVGAGLALWDMEKTPADLVAAVTNNGVRSQSLEKSSRDEGLTFIDADDESQEDTDTSLTFIDANEESENTESEGGEGDPEGDSEENNEGGNLDPSADAVTEAEDGTIIVSSELAGVGSIVKAGTGEALTVVAAQTDVANPNEGYPLPFTAVDDSYFDDALFIGDSRFYGFMMWSGISGANYCATSFNIFQYETFKVVQTGNGKVPIFSALPYNAFTKIYIKVGLNEMGSSEEKFEAKYAEIIARLREMEPRAIIYIHAVLPVTAAKSASDKTHSNPNIIARNASLKQFARDQQCYFIDAGPVLSDESGCLKPEMTGDGIHLSSRYMGVWKQYLMENAVVVE